MAKVPQARATEISPIILKGFLTQYARTENEKEQCKANNLQACSVVAPWFLKQSSDFQKAAFVNPAIILGVPGLPAEVGEAIRTQQAGTPAAGTATVGTSTANNSFSIGSDGRPIFSGSASNAQEILGRLPGQGSQTTDPGSGGNLVNQHPSNWHYYGDEDVPMYEKGPDSTPQNQQGQQQGGVDLPQPGNAQITLVNDRSGVFRSEESKASVSIANNYQIYSFLLENLLSQGINFDSASYYAQKGTESVIANANSGVFETTINVSKDNNGVPSILIQRDEDANSVHPQASEAQKAAALQSLQSGILNHPLPGWWDPSDNAYELDPKVKRAPTAAIQTQISTSTGRASLRLGNVGAGVNGNNPTGDPLGANISGPVVQSCGGPGKPVCSGQ